MQINSTTPTTNNINWYDMQPPKLEWLVDGLIPIDGNVSVSGKPKAGKSTFIRSLVAAMIKGTKFLDRSIGVPQGTAKVVYIHLDRKDVPERVAAELRSLGITREDADRLIFKTAQDMPTNYPERLQWLKSLVAEHQPDCVVIDLLLQFVEVENTNEYAAILKTLNQLQDALKSTPYNGALICALHARKADNSSDPGDNMLGSTAQRGSFVTNIILARNRQDNAYTILSDQTLRDDIYGEIDETILLKSPDGTLCLGQKVCDFRKVEKQSKSEDDCQRLLSFISDNPGCSMKQIMSGLNMSGKHALSLLKQADGLVRKEGGGVKNDPLRYYCGVGSYSVRANVVPITQPKHYAVDELDSLMDEESTSFG